MKRPHYVLKYIIVVLLLSLEQLVVAQGVDVEIYTPYTQVSVTPGSTVNYALDIINHSAKTINTPIAISALPRSWDYSLTAGGMHLDQLAVRAQKQQTVKLKVDVPYQVRKGNYTFYVRLDSLETQALSIRVSSGGSNKTELSCDQRNMEGNSTSSFSFNAELKNKTASKQQYALMANAPKGWNVVIKPNYKQATSTEVEADGSKSINYTIKPPYNVKAGQYTIPVKAVSGSSSAQMDLEIVITGTYAMSLTTPTGRVSTQTTAGETEKIELLIKNTGSVMLKDIALSASKPSQWQAHFEPQNISQLEPGKVATVYLSVEAAKHAIPGDYMTKIKASSSEVKQELSLRVMVKTPALMSYIGFIIILLSLGVLLFLMRKFGRR